MVILLIGPHCVGKTETGKAAAQAMKNCLFFDLDDVIAKSTGKDIRTVLHELGSAGFVDRCRSVVELLEKEHPHAVLLVAVGAGALFDAERASEWLRRHKLIALMAQPEEVLRRTKKKHCYKSPVDFIAKEYSMERRRLYALAEPVIDTDGLTFAEQVRRLAVTVERLVSSSV